MVYYPLSVTPSILEGSQVRTHLLFRHVGWFAVCLFSSCAGSKLAHTIMVHSCIIILMHWNIRLMNHTAPTMPVANLTCDAKMNKVRVAYIYICMYDHGPFIYLLNYVNSQPSQLTSTKWGISWLYPYSVTVKNRHMSNFQMAIDWVITWPPVN